MRPREIGVPRMETPLKLAGAAGKFQIVHGAPFAKVLGNTFPHQFRDRPLFKPCLRLQRLGLLRGQLNLYSLHAVMLSKNTA